MSGADALEPQLLTRLVAGQMIPFGGDRAAVVSDSLAASFVAGDRLVVVQETGDLLRIPAADHDLVTEVVDRAVAAFAELRSCTDDQISRFLEGFADRLADPEVVHRLAEANRGDVEAARAAGRATGRLVLDEAMRRQMIEGLRMWAADDGGRSAHLRSIDHSGWGVELWRAPLGVVGFVFEGRPNVFADAVGVLRTGNTVVLRIGSDALGTARAIASRALLPALAAAGLPPGAVGLIDSPARSAGWALFSDRRLGLAVARGSGAAVAQLGAVARQSGVPVSLHGTGGAWMVVTEHADHERLGLAIRNSLDRKVCNTLNVLCLVGSAASSHLDTCLAALTETGAAGVPAVIHLDRHTSRRWPEIQAAASARGPVHALDRAELGTEWEWDTVPEVSLAVVEQLDDAIELFNTHSPRFVASLLSERADEQQRFYDGVDAPFVGDGFTRWVDGQYAFSSPELGLSNWQTGRLLGRGAVLSGDSVHTLRVRARVTDAGLHR